MPQLKMFLKERTRKYLKDMVSLIEQDMAACGDPMWVIVNHLKVKTKANMVNTPKQDKSQESVVFLSHKLDI